MAILCKVFYIEVLLLLFYSCNEAFRFHKQVYSSKSNYMNVKPQERHSHLQCDKQAIKYLPLSTPDMKHLAFLLANISDHIDTNPALAVSTVTREMGWLYSRNVTGLTNMLLQQFPEFRSDKGMMRSYMFVMDFLEVIVEETQAMIKKHQNTLRLILEAAKIGESRVDEVLFQNREEVVSPDFMVYLDSEIESIDTEAEGEAAYQASARAMEQMLVTVKLRVLDEVGRSLGIDVQELPRLAAENDPTQLREKTLAHIQGHGPAGRQLLLQTLRIMNKELAKRYQQVDATLQERLRQVEEAVSAAVDADQAARTS